MSRQNCELDHHMELSMQDDKAPNPKLFRRNARSHMRQWIKRELSAEPAHEKSVLLPKGVATEGKNFFPDVAAIAEERFPQCFSDSAFGRRSLAGDALCSAHAPFNLFGPLRRHLENGTATKVLNSIIGCKINDIISVSFEIPSKRKDNPLKDNTAFDAAISAINGSDDVFIGVEVKFTEGPYGWTEKERKNMSNESGVYVKLTKTSKLINSDASQSLANCHLKQMWRNMLLGEAINADNFHYIHLYPKGNIYQSHVVAQFANLLTEAGFSSFHALTYESYIKLLDEFIPGSEWQTYLKRRYLFTSV